MTTQTEESRHKKIVAEIVRKVRNKYTRTGMNQADQLDTLWNHLGQTPDWVIECFEEEIKKALTQERTRLKEEIEKWIETQEKHPLLHRDMRQALKVVREELQRTLKD